MIKKITVTNYVGDSLELDPFHPEDSGFIIKSIDGLGPVKSSINTAESATMDGSIYNSAKSEQRNIVFDFQFMSDSSIEDVRLKSYKFFPNKKQLTIRVETDRRTAEITGYVEENKPDIFSENEGCQVSIICPDPYFYSVEEQETTFSGVNPRFTFPFSNPVGEKTLIMGDIVRYKERTINYYGDEETGVTIKIHATGPIENITIYNAKTDESMNINTDKIRALTGSGIIAKDDIIINTVKGHKSMKLIRDGITTNILSALGRGQKWFTLAIGENVFYHVVSSGEQFMDLTISNRVLYEGV